MAEDLEPNLVNSRESKKLDLDGYVFSIEIYRLEADPTRTLEVVDQEGTRHLWDEQFQTDVEALLAAKPAIEAEAPGAFIQGNNIVPYPKT